MKRKAQQPARSLRDFAGKRRTRQCPMCALPPGVIAQIRRRDTKKIKLDVVLAWLREEYAVTITAEQYFQHSNGGHEKYLSE